MTDPISDFLTRIRNALAANKAEVVVPYSKLKENLANLLANQGWLEKVEMVEEEPMGRHKSSFRQLRVVLKYDQSGTPLISGIRRFSKPGQRIYSKSSEIPKVPYGIGATILSTSRGLMTDRQAREQRVGGEVICQIW